MITKMSAQDLKKFFYNPPKGGNAAGVPTQNSMGLLPRKQECSPHGGGVSVAERRRKREYENMSDEDRQKQYMEEYSEPPRPASGPDAITDLRTAFESGEALARNNRQESARAQNSPYGVSEDVGQPEVRNYRRSPSSNVGMGRENGDNYYEYEQLRSGDATAGVPETQQLPRRKVRLQLNPDTSESVRSDGKPVEDMGVSSRDPAPQKSEKEFA